MVLFGGAPTTLVGHVVLHAFEGALVGGLCDWFAVAKTYKAVVTHRDAIADGIGNWVADELLSREVIKSELDKVVHSEEVRTKAYVWVDRTLGSAEHTAELLTSLWEKAEPTVVDWIVAADVTPRGMGSLADAFRDPRIAHVLRACVGEILLTIADHEDLPPLVRRLRKELPLMARVFVSTEEVSKRVRAAGEELTRPAPPDTPDEGWIDRTVALLIDAGGSYVQAWNGLTQLERRGAIEAGLEHLRTPVLDTLGRVAHRERERLRKLVTLSEHPAVRVVLEQIESYLDDDLSTEVGRVVTAALKDRDPDDFRRNLETQTREHLETIRINGTVLGLGIGAAVGLLLGLV